MATEKKKTAMKIVPPDKKKCVWMEAGVVSYKLCDNNFDCPTCAYDRGMQIKMARQRAAMANIEEPVKVDGTADKAFESWVEKMLKLPADQRKCRYMISGQVSRKICPNAYECGNCSFDQMMQEKLQPEELELQKLLEVDGFLVADGYYYHEGHTWARPEHGGRVRVGLDDFAAKLIGKLKKLGLPSIGQEVKQGEAVLQLQRNGNAARAVSPVDGIVTYINYDLLENPELAISNPYEKGWLFIVEPTKLKKSLKNLYFGKEVKKFFDEEKEELLKEVHEEIAIAADGGQPIKDIFTDIEGDKWQSIVKKFLRS